jgi:NAD(P)-dependent dehydrogenase (short-subunit alcohol dehydrogenase family)
MVSRIRSGLISNYGYSAYGASKFGVVGLATTLRYEYEGRGEGSKVAFFPVKCSNILFGIRNNA